MAIAMHKNVNSHKEPVNNTGKFVILILCKQAACHVYGLEVINLI